MSTVDAQRNLPLDVLRGMTVALMIIVNTPGDYQNVHTALLHAHWHGFTLADFVFPTFLFAVGNSMAFSFYKHSGICKVRLLHKVGRRAAIIFGLGLLLNYFPFYRFENGVWIAVNLLDIRFWGVLQRIAVCYVLASVMVLYVTEKYLIACCLAVLALYWMVLRLVGGAPDPYGLEALSTNVVTRIDLMLLPSRNIYQAYGVPFDPEGLLSSFPAAVNVVAGYCTARAVRSRPALSSAWVLVVCGIGLLGFALAIERFVPINKPLWTSSYVLYATGWDLMLLSAMIVVLEILDLGRWTYFFEVLGRNPIFIYVLSAIGIYVLALLAGMNLVFTSVFFNDSFVKSVGAKNASLIFSTIYLMGLWAIAWVLDRKNIFIRI